MLCCPKYIGYQTFITKALDGCWVLLISMVTKISVPVHPWFKYPINIPNQHREIHHPFASNFQITGIGYAMTLVSSYFCFYYIIIMAYSIFYMFASMQSELPWRGCNHTWNTPNCFEGSLSLNKTLNLSDPMSTATPNASERVWATEEYWK